jgi:hypothetical protein
MNISDNNNKLENLSIIEINNKLKLYMLLYDTLIKIKDEINSNSNQYNKNSVNILLKAMEENEKHSRSQHNDNNAGKYLYLCAMN